jgi:hypothetical protein
MAQQTCVTSPEQANRNNDVKAAGVSMRSTDIFSLDFTTPNAAQSLEIRNLVGDANLDAKQAIRKLELAIVRGCREEAVWRLLASLYLGTDDMRAVNDLEARHQQIFGIPVYAILRQPSAPREAERKLFDLPARITRGALPPVEEVVAACTGASGAVLDFTRIRGADPTGLDELINIFAALPRDYRRPQMPGVDRFIVSLEGAAQSETGTRTMWDLLFAYDRLTQDQARFGEHADQFLTRFGVAPPAY